MSDAKKTDSTIQGDAHNTSEPIQTKDAHNTSEPIQAKGDAHNTSEPAK